MHTLITHHLPHSVLDITPWICSAKLCYDKYFSGFLLKESNHKSTVGREDITQSLKERLHTPLNTVSQNSQQNELLWANPCDNLLKHNFWEITCYSYKTKWASYRYSKPQSISGIAWFSYSPVIFTLPRTRS